MCVCLLDEMCVRLSGVVTWQTQNVVLKKHLDICLLTQFVLGEFVELLMKVYKIYSYILLIITLCAL